MTGGVVGGWFKRRGGRSRARTVSAVGGGALGWCVSAGYAVWCVSQQRGVLCQSVTSSTVSNLPSIPVPSFVLVCCASAMLLFLMLCNISICCGLQYF